MGFLGRSKAVEVAVFFLPKLTSPKVFLQIWMKKLWKKHMCFSGQKYNMSPTSKIPKYHGDPGTPKQTWLFKKKQPVEEKYVTQIILSHHKFDQMFHLKVNGYLFLQSICRDTKRWSTINFKASASPTKSSKTFGLRLQPGHKWWKRKMQSSKKRQVEPVSSDKFYFVVPKCFKFKPWPMKWTAELCFCSIACVCIVLQVLQV